MLKSYGRTCDEDTEGDEQLVSCREGTTDLRRRGLGLVHGHGGTKRTDAEATDETADGKLLPNVFRSNLDNDAYDEDDTFARHRTTTTKDIRNSRNTSAQLHVG